jgi:hypothetical protein
MVLAPSTLGSSAGRRAPAKKNRQGVRPGGWGVDGWGRLRAPIDSFRQWPEKAIKEEKEANARHLRQNPKRVELYWIHCGAASRPLEQRRKEAPAASAELAVLGQCPARASSANGGNEALFHAVAQARASALWAHGPLRRTKNPRLTDRLGPTNGQGLIDGPADGAQLARALRAR